MRVPMIDPTAEAQIKAFHHGYERARLTTPPRPRDPLADAEGEVRPVARVKYQHPPLSEDEADAEVEFDLAEAMMIGALD